MDDADIHEMFQSLGPVSIRRMFGGKGVYCDGLIIAIEIDGEIKLKADRQSAPDFEAAGCSQWRYDGKSKPVFMPYWSIPDEAFDDPDIMAQWVGRALEAALRLGKKGEGKA